MCLIALILTNTGTRNKSISRSTGCACGSIRTNITVGAAGCKEKITVMFQTSTDIIDLHYKPPYKAAGRSDMSICYTTTNFFFKQQTKKVKEIQLNSTCCLLDMLKLIQMITVMVRITVLDNTADFQKYAFLLRVSV